MNEDFKDAWRYYLEGMLERVPESVARPEWITQNKHPLGLELVRLQPSRDPGPRQDFHVRLTVGHPITPQELAEMLEIVKEMFQETFACSVDFVSSEPAQAPRRPPYMTRLESW